MYSKWHLTATRLVSPACAGGFKADLGGGVGGRSLFFVMAGRGGIAGAVSEPGG